MGKVMLVCGHKWNTSNETTIGVQTGDYVMMRQKRERKRERGREGWREREL